MMKNNEIFNSDKYLDDNDGGLRTLSTCYQKQLLNLEERLLGGLSERSSRYGSIESEKER